MINGNKNEAGNKKNRSHRYNINTPRPRHKHKYAKYQICLRLMMIICVKRNIWSSIHEKQMQHWGWAEKESVASIKKLVSCIFDQSRCYMLYIIWKRV